MNQTLTPNTSTSMPTLSAPDCPHRRQPTSGSKTEDGREFVVFRCMLERRCTLTDFGLTKNGKPLAVCADCNRQNEPGPPEGPLVQIRQPEFPEPVGDHLKAILGESWIRVPSCGQCDKWRRDMNRLGIAGCEEHRAEIIAHLEEMADEYPRLSPNPIVRGLGWLKMGLMRARGFKTVEDILNAAIERTRNQTRT